MIIQVFGMHRAKQDCLWQYCTCAAMPERSCGTEEGTGKSLPPELNVTYSKGKEEQWSPSRKGKGPSRVGDARYAAGAANAAVLCLKLPASAAPWSISPARINARPQVLGAKDSWHQGQAT